MPLTNRTLALLHGVRVLPSADAVDVAEYAAVVDALYGTGLNHAIEGDAAILIHRLSDHPQIPVIAVDIPSGLDGTTGRALGADVVRAAETVTFHRIKQGLLLRQGVEYTGKITVQPILIRPGDDIDLGFGGLEMLSPAALAPLFARHTRASQRRLRPRGDFLRFARDGRRGGVLRQCLASARVRG